MELDVPSNPWPKESDDDVLRTIRAFVVGQSSFTTFREQLRRLALEMPCGWFSPATQQTLDQVYEWVCETSESPSAEDRGYGVIDVEELRRRLLPLPGVPHAP